MQLLKMITKEDNPYDLQPIFTFSITYTPGMENDDEDHYTDINEHVLTKIFTNRLMELDVIKESIHNLMKVNIKLMYKIMEADTLSEWCALRNETAEELEKALEKK